MSEAVFSSVWTWLSSGGTCPSSLSTRKPWSGEDITIEAGVRPGSSSSGPGVSSSGHSREWLSGVTHRVLIVTLRTFGKLSIPQIQPLVKVSTNHRAFRHFGCLGQPFLIANRWTEIIRPPGPVVVTSLSLRLPHLHKSSIGVGGKPIFNINKKK